VADVLWHRGAYRARQVWQAFHPQVEAGELQIVDDTLSPRLRQVFDGMERRDQRHALEVARRLLAEEAPDQDLLTAALLHDCGKGSVPVWLRIAKVLAPGWVRAVAREEDANWRAAAFRLVHHAELGARAAAEAGASPLTVALIRGAVSPGETGILARLLAADDAS
jgi:hypothetical protein